MWGIIPAAGAGTRIQPLGFSKEMLPVGTYPVHGNERVRPVSSYLVERMRHAGCERFCFVISADKIDIVKYYGGTGEGTPIEGSTIVYSVQDKPTGFCSAIFTPYSFLHSHDVLVGLPDTVWFPKNALADVAVNTNELTFVCFPVEDARPFDAVVIGTSGRVTHIEPKAERPTTNWIWGAFYIPVHAYEQLYWLWRERRYESFGDLTNAYLAEGGEAYAVCTGTKYYDVGTPEGYRKVTEEARTWGA